MTTICATKFNASSDISYRSPWTNSKGMKSVGINSKAAGTQLHLRVPMMMTWGVNENEHTPGEKKYDMSLQFPRAGEETPATRAFLKNMEAFEAQLVKDAVSHSQEWWNQKSISAELAADRFHPMLYRSKDKATGEPIPGKAPSLRVKIDCWDGKFKCEIYDNGSDPERLPLYPSDNPEVTPAILIPKMTQVACLIKCGGVYFSNGKFGVTWRLVQAVVKPRASVQSILGKCQISLSTEEVSQLEVASEDDQDSTMVDDDGFEGGAEQPAVERTPTPPPASPVKPKPKAKRRVVRRKPAA